MCVSVCLSFGLLIHLAVLLYSLNLSFELHKELDNQQANNYLKVEGSFDRACGLIASDF